VFGSAALAAAERVRVGFLAGLLELVLCGRQRRRDVLEVARCSPTWRRTPPATRCCGAIAPRLPSRQTKLTFRLMYRGRRLRIEVTPDTATYERLAGELLELLHHGEALTVQESSAQSRALPAAPDPPPVQQPPGRTPPRRHRET
jgi:hypothetical protein